MPETTVAGGFTVVYSRVHVFPLERKEAKHRHVKVARSPTSTYGLATLNRFRIKTFYGHLASEFWIFFYVTDCTRDDVTMCLSSVCLFALALYSLKL